VRDPVENARDTTDLHFAAPQVFATNLTVFIFLELLLSFLQIVFGGYHVDRHAFYVLERYLSHPASTVRQMSSSVFKNIATKNGRLPRNMSSKRENSQACPEATKDCTVGAAEGASIDNIPRNTMSDPVLLFLVLEHLVRAWRVPLPSSCSPPPFLVSVQDLASSSSENCTTHSWQWKEGRMLAYELILNYIALNHRHYIEFSYSGSSVLSTSDGVELSSATMAPLASHAPHAGPDIPQRYNI
jgi:hypothetical protein